MEHLPVPLAHRILSYLDLHDLISLRLASKKLNFLVDSFRIDELIVHNSWPTKRTKGNWFYVKVPQNFLRMVSESEIGLLLAPTGLIKTDKLRRLKLDSFNQNLLTIRPADLNRFHLLEILDIDLDHLRCSNETECLFLPKLLALRLQTSNKLSIRFVTPRLKALNMCTFQTGSLAFSHPLSVVHLQSFTYSSDLRVFTNVAYLECYDSLSEEIFESFPKLRTLRIESRCDPMPVVRERNAKDPLHLLKIYHLGVRLNFGTELDVEQFDEHEKFDSINRDRLPFYLRNYNLLIDSLRHAEKLDYSTLTTWMGKHNNEIVRFQEFYERFNDVRVIVVNRRVEDRYCLIRLIYNCPNLYVLKLSDSRLDQAFYDLLPEIASLFKLQICESEFVGLRFEFVARMRLLHTFRTNQDLRLSEQFELDRMKHLCSFEFRINDRPIIVSVQNEPEAKFKVSLGSFGALAEKRTFAGLVEWCESFRNRERNVILEEQERVKRLERKRRSGSSTKCKLM